MARITGTVVCFVLVSLLGNVAAAYNTIYANENCGKDISLDKPVILRASRDNTLPANYKCAVIFKATTSSIIGGMPLVLARFLKLDLSPGNGLNCTDARIDLQDGIRNPVPITDNKGLCGHLPPQPYDYTTRNDSFMTVQLTTYSAPQKVDFQIVMQSFQKVEAGQECFPGEFECNNDRCISNSLKCDGYDNCGDLSDETYEKCKPTLYLDEICGMSFTVNDMVKLVSSRSKNLIPALSCKVDISSHIETIGGQPRILAHVRDMGLAPASPTGTCDAVRLDIYDGIRDPFLISGPNGVCGTNPAVTNYATYNDSFMTMEMKTFNSPQVGSFHFTLTSFHSGECFTGEYKCNNGRCIDSYLQCNGYDNCGDNSDETNDLCQTIAALTGGAIAAIVLAALLFAIGFPILMFYVLCHRPRQKYSSI